MPAAPAPFAGAPGAAVALAPPAQGAAAPFPHAAVARIVPPVAPPPVATGAVARSLGDAYRAIVGARDPAAAATASFAYAQAEQRALRGDAAGALAQAHAAQAAAAGTAPIVLAPARPFVPAQPPVPGADARALPGQPPVPDAAAGAGDAELRAARAAIGLARGAGRGSLDAATAQYGRALDDYLSGNRAAEQREARDAFDRAAVLLPARP